MLRSNVAITWQAIISASKKEAMAKNKRAGQGKDGMPEINSSSNVQKETDCQNIARMVHGQLSINCSICPCQVTSSRSCMMLSLEPELHHICICRMLSLKTNTNLCWDSLLHHCHFVCFVRYGSESQMIFRFTFQSHETRLLSCESCPTMLATEVEARRDERLELIACVRHGGSLRGVEDGLQEHMELYLINYLGFGAIGRLEDGIGDGTSIFFFDGVDDTFLMATVTLLIMLLIAKWICGEGIAFQYISHLLLLLWSLENLFQVDMEWMELCYCCCTRIVISICR